MSTTVSLVDQLDYDISLAHIVLGVVRADWRRCPSAENGRRVAEAEAAVDELLDLRLTARGA